ncbi:hypothetical protein E3O55_08530 [Cryobacterium sp. MDB1-18-2]|uniref:peptidoglycan DD-metalloendopeptidase family protein n=1 Tax=unclassified Cryobacterium TaxID=2649013 RepID=UPI0010699511|nr:MULTISPECIES: peptidoglycan DD-metalloendopeptidase family protein [unclassified Cryobacterium]TFC30119.1 hypothetical protein E3O55_08530 [Cryobacterium sp. MDB1-18-2]TFC41399.1 hypothetical protein E3O50_09970 [Cryobacterium sp. MDB1-18-1]
MAWQNFYSHWGNAFGLKATGYGQNGHRGSDVTGVTAGDVIPAYRSGVVRKVQFSSFLGTVIVIEADADGKFDGYCHARDGALVTVGQRVAAGSGLGRVAGYGDRHGTSWDGVHCHLTRADTLEGVFSGTVYDPRPTVLAAIAASLNSASSSVAFMATAVLTAPAATQSTKEEEPMFKFVNAADGTPEERGVYAVGKGGKKHLSGQEKGLLERWRNEDSRDSLLLAEMDIITAVLSIVA